MWKEPESRALVVGMAALTLFLWFVPQKWGGGSFTSGISRAQHPRSNSAAFASCPFCTELAHHAWWLVLLSIKLVAILVIGVAGAVLARAWRSRPGWKPTGSRDRALVVLVLLGLFGYVWWILIALETQAGFSGDDRYLVIDSGFIDICGAAGFGWAAIGLARLVRQWAPAARKRARHGRATLGTTGVAGLVFLFVPNWVGGNLIDLPATHRSLVYQATLRKNLSSLIARAGGAKALEHCGAGHVMVEGFQVPMTAWYFDSRTIDVQDQPTTDSAGQAVPPKPWPNVIFQDRDTDNSAQPLLPLVQTIRDWEREGAHYKFVSTKEMYFFEDCAAQPNDPKQLWTS
jgi:hypothetical protein